MSEKLCFKDMTECKNYRFAAYRGNIVNKKTHDGNFNPMPNLFLYMLTNFFFLRISLQPDVHP